jgi:hypothetical protein
LTNPAAAFVPAALKLLAAPIVSFAPYFDGYQVSCANAPALNDAAAHRTKRFIAVSLNYVSLQNEAAGRLL